MRSDYEQRKANRIARYQELAGKNAKKAEEQHDRAKEMASVIPFDQPILIGHHSEARDRNYREKIQNLFGKSYESDEKSKYYEHKADVVMTNDAISSDDPNALEKLREKLNDMERLQGFMKAANKLIRNSKLSEEARIEMLKPFNVDDQLIEQVIKGKLGFERFSLSNNSQNMARVRKRIEQLEKNAKIESNEITVNGVRIFQNMEANRLQLFFQGKPNEEIRQQLKRNGFRWSPREGAWQRHVTRRAQYAALEIVKSINDTKSNGA